MDGAGKVTRAAAKCKGPGLGLNLMDSCWIQALQTRPRVPGNQYCRSSTRPALGRWERSCFRNQRKLQDSWGFYSSHSYCKPSSPSISVLGGKRSPRFLANGIATCAYPIKELNAAAAPALFPDTLALANSKQSNVKYILLHCWADGIAWRKLQKATGQMAAALFFPRYFINPRESKEIYWILNSSFTYSLKSSSASELAVTAGLQLAVILKICSKVWEVSFWGGIKR